MTEQFMIEQAEQLARYAHRKQKRKYTDEPYFEHCDRVAKTVAAEGGTSKMVAAAYLHDVVEDTLVTLDDLVDRFPHSVVSMVYDLTDHFTPEKYPTRNRDWRKLQEAHRLAKCSPEVKAIKRADIADNTRDIMENAPSGFARVYTAEKEYLLSLID